MTAVCSEWQVTIDGEAYVVAERRWTDLGAVILDVIHRDDRDAGGRRRPCGRVRIEKVRRFEFEPAWPDDGWYRGEPSANALRRSTVLARVAATWLDAEASRVMSDPGAAARPDTTEGR